MIKIGLDAGHGLHTAGKQTPDGIKEWILNDEVCDRIVRILSRYNCEIIRIDGDEGEGDESLSERVSSYIREGVSAFVSIHHNAFTGNWNSATGVEVYTDKNPTVQDKRFAEIVYNKLVEYTGLRGRGIKRSNFYVINQNQIPAILCEGGFMDSINDYPIITSESGKEAYAKAVAEGLIEFLGLTENQIGSNPTYEKISVTYQVWDDVQNRWLPNVVDTTDYAGIFGYDVCAIYANLSKGNIYYKVHVKGGRWLPQVINRTDYAGIFNRPIDALMMKTDTGKTIHYAVHLRRRKVWLPYVTGYNENESYNGYAGIIGQEADAVIVYLD